MSRTMALLEQRISMTEDRLTNVVAYSRGMVEVPSSLQRNAVSSETKKMAFESKATEVRTDHIQEESFEVEHVDGTQSSSYEEVEADAQTG